MTITSIEASLERALDHAAVDTKRCAVDGRGQRARDEGDEWSDFLGAANRLINDVGRALSKNSFSNWAKDWPDVFASVLTKSSTPRVRVGPGSTLLTVMPVPATDSARPRETASCAVFVMP